MRLLLALLLGSTISWGQTPAKSDAYFIMYSMDSPSDGWTGLTPCDPPEENVICLKPTRETRIEHALSLDAARKFVFDGFVKMIEYYDDSCNTVSLIKEQSGDSLLTTFCGMSEKPDRPKPMHPKLLGVYSATAVPFTSRTVEKRVVTETETIYEIGGAE